LSDLLGAEDHGYELTELRIAMPAAMARLTEREQRIIALRFHGNQTQDRIAAQIGVSQMHVSRLLADALRKLREYLDPDVAPKYRGKRAEQSASRSAQTP